MQVHIDPRRVLATLRALARFGAQGKGVSRPALSPEDMAARRWLAGQMREAGLEADIDAVGNVYGRTPGVRHALLVGSHSDSVPNGGWLDGALGVVYGLEAARAWRAQQPHAPVGIDVIAFSDEEGRYLSCLGSRSFCEALDGIDPGRLQYGGATLAEAAAAAGLPAQGLARLEPARHLAYLEAHIEQGPRLDDGGLDVGIVTGIAGMQRYLVQFGGRADHAGTTPMAVRKDAALAAFEFALACEAALRRAGGPDSVWNFGALALQPGVANVVARSATLTVEFRDLSPEVLERLAQALHECVSLRDGQRGVSVAATRQNALAPARMDPALQAHLQAQARQAGARSLALPSGAIHDAMVLARRVPTAMLFIPSIGGRSHTPVEDTAERHIMLGAEVFCGALARAAQQAAPGGAAAK
ncbi:hydantoinase/carbamoylase family amidase [Orrella sp. JC864]|uniref:hydantoinase/carbamoylase family amidase n=1 Tax=Orrella sp. JC864 TaxID=3120298 RepID=UPI003007F82C